MTWPPLRSITSIPGVSFTMIATPHLGREWAFVYWCVEADRG